VLASFFFSSRRRHTRSKRDWSSDVCSSDLLVDNTTNPHDHHGISVKIGDEMSDRLLLDYSLVSATYNVGGHGRGMIAILGPTNMPYSKMIGLVEVFQKELTKKLIDYYRNFDE